MFSGSKPLFCASDNRFYAAPKELELVRRIYKKKGFTNIEVQVSQPRCALISPMTVCCT